MTENNMETFSTLSQKSPDREQNEKMTFSSSQLRGNGIIAGCHGSNGQILIGDSFETRTFKPVH